MNWLGVAIIGWLALGLEGSLRHTLRLGHTGIAPSFVVPVVVIVALAASPLQATWAAVILGIAIDLTSVAPSGGVGAPVPVVGPHALGFALAAQAVLAMRQMVIRRHPLSIGVMSMVFAVIVGIVASAVFTVRSFVPALADAVAWNAGRELMERSGSGVYTGMVAAVMAILLVPVFQGLGFNLSGKRAGYG